MCKQAAASTNECGTEWCTKVVVVDDTGGGQHTCICATAAVAQLGIRGVSVKRATAVMGVRPATVSSLEHEVSPDSHVVLLQSQPREWPS